MNHDDLGNYSHTQVRELRQQIVALQTQVATEAERADYAWRNTRTIEAARQEEMTKRDKLTKALRAAERFIAGFEGDELQEGIDELLTEIRTALDIYPIPEFLRRNHG